MTWWTEERRQLALDVALAWLVVWVLHRVGMQVALQTPMPWSGAWWDVLWTVPCTLLALLVGWRWPVLGVAVTVPVLILSAVDMRAFALLMSAMHQAVDRIWIRDAYLSGELLAVDANTDPLEMAVIATGPVTLLLLRVVPWGRPGMRARGVVVLAGLLLLASALAPSQAATWPTEARHNPMVHLLFAVPPVEEEGFLVGNAPDASVPAPVPAPVDVTPLAGDATPVTTDVQAGGGLRMRPTDPAIIDQAPVHKILPPPAEKPWNVVWVIMESTGTRYFEGETFPQKPPMPTLHKLASEGWYLSRHQSPSNSSATSIFTQMSGLFASPQMQMFSIQPENYIPALPAFLPPQYEKFLYTPGKLTYFFPKPFLQHAGLTEMVGFDETVVSRNPGGEFLSKDEIGVMSTFLDRIHRAQEPFLGIYYSYAPHWPYTDYGPKWRRYAGGRLIDHYHNNLWLLDNQIARIVEQLRADGRLERTILVFVGDHGEAFGQHERNWAHARGSYRENFETPAILWQPRLFAPRKVTERTVHADLLPTILDALHIPYDDTLFQGESLFQDHFRRHATFYWANEGMVTVEREDGLKLSWSPLDKRCRVHDLRVDPQERRPAACQTQPVWLTILRTWATEQRARLDAYSAAVRTHRGLAAPAPAAAPRGPAAPPGRATAPDAPPSSDAESPTGD